MNARTRYWPAVIRKGARMKKQKIKTITQEKYDMLRANFHLLTEVLSADNHRLLNEVTARWPKLCKKAEVL